MVALNLLRQKILLDPFKAGLAYVDPFGTQQPCGDACQVIHFVDLQHGEVDRVIVAVFETGIPEHRCICVLLGRTEALRVRCFQPANAVHRIDIAGGGKRFPCVAVTQVRKHTNAEVAITKLFHGPETGTYADIGLYFFFVGAVIDRQALADRFKLRISEAFFEEDIVGEQFVVASNRVFQQVRLVALAFIDALPVIAVITFISKAVFECGEIVVADAAGYLKKGFVRDYFRAHLDHAAAEFGRKSGGEGFLYQHTVDDAGRKQIYRNCACDRFRAGEGRAVHHGGRIAFAQTANVDEFAVRKVEA